MKKSFGEFQFDDELRLLSRAGNPIRLAGQAVELLSVFLETPGELISREEICQRLWPDSHVEFEHSLDVLMSRLRAVLQEGSGIRYIETVPRKGYRFVQPVSAQIEVAIDTRSRKFRSLGTYAAVALIAAMVAIMFVRTRYNRFVPTRHSQVSSPNR